MATTENPMLKNIESGDIIEIIKSPFTMGRGLESDYVIKSKVVSRTHCSLEKLDGGWILKDLSTNGTMVNDDLFKREESAILHNNDEICLGFQNYTYKFLIKTERVPNLHIERLKAEESVIASRNSLSPSPGSPFDENGVSDEVLNNLADDILDNVAENKPTRPESKNSAREPDNILTESGAELENVDSNVLENILKQPLSSTIDTDTRSGIGKPPECPNSEESSQSVYQFNMIADPIQLMLQPSGTVNQAEQHNKSRCLLQSATNNIQACATSSISSPTLRHLEETTSELGNPENALDQLLRHSDKNSNSENNDKRDEESSNRHLAVDNKNTAPNTETDYLQAILEGLARTGESGMSGNKNSGNEYNVQTAGTSNSHLIMDNKSTAAKRDSDDLQAILKNLANTSSSGMSGDKNSSSSNENNIEKAATSSNSYSIVDNKTVALKDESDNLQVVMENVSNTDESPSGSSSNTVTYSLPDEFPNADINNLPATTDDKIVITDTTDDKILATAKVTSTTDITEKPDLLDTTNITDKREIFKIHFSEVLNDVVRKYTDYSEPGPSSSTTGPAKTVSESTVIEPNHHKRTYTSIEPPLKLINTPTTVISTASTKSGNLQAKSSTSFLSVASPTNSNKKVKVMTPTVTAHSSKSNQKRTSNQLVMTLPSTVAASNPSVITISNTQLQKILGNQSFKNTNVPVSSTAYSSAGSRSAKHQVIIVKPDKSHGSRSLTQGSNTTLKTYTIIRPEPVSTAPVSSSNTRSMQELNVSSSILSLNHTITTQSGLSNMQGNLTNTTANLPSLTATVTLSNSASATCRSSTAAAASSNNTTQGTTNQLNINDNIAGLPVGNNMHLVDSQALPVANHEVVTSTITTEESRHIKKTSVIKYHESQEASTSKQPNKPDLNKQDQGPDQNYYEEMENELMCTICANLFIKTVTLGCSHSFCQYCIEAWKKNKSDCPICRRKIESTTRTLVLDNIIEKVIESAPLEDKKQRSETVEERKKIEEAENAAKNKQKRRRGRNVQPAPPPPPPPPPPVVNLVDSPSTTDNDDSDDSENSFDYDDYDNDDWYNGVPGVYYGGYGRCYNCGDRGHWANGCPYR